MGKYLQREGPLQPRLVCRLETYIVLAYQEYRHSNKEKLPLLRFMLWRKHKLVCAHGVTHGRLPGFSLLRKSKLSFTSENYRHPPPRIQLTLHYTTLRVRALKLNKDLFLTAKTADS